MVQKMQGKTSQAPPCKTQLLLQLTRRPALMLQLRKSGEAHGSTNHLF